MNTTSIEVTAGLGGFLVLFALALAVWFLGRDLTRRLRRMRHAEERRRADGHPDQQGPERPGQEPDPLA